MLGYVYLKVNDPDEAKSFFKRSLELYEHVNNFLGQGHAYYGLRDMYLRSNNWKSVCPTTLKRMT